MAAIDTIIMKKKKNIPIPNNPIPRVTLASIESLAIPLVQEVVFLADYRCAKCQRRVAQVMSKMNGETESVMISLLEKKITVIYKIPKVELSDEQSASILCNPLSKVASVFMTIFLPSRSR